MPRVGLIVYVSPKTGIQEKKHTAMFTAEIDTPNGMELQSFHLKCKSKKEAELTRKVYQDKLDGAGPFTFIQYSA
jgi:hypothetical protein